VAGRTGPERLSVSRVLYAHIKMISKSPVLTDDQTAEQLLHLEVTLNVFLVPPRRLLPALLLAQAQAQTALPQPVHVPLQQQGLVD
jgi:hypothetical protein